MKKNVKDLLKIGILVPAMVLSLAACGASGSNKPSEPAPSGETTQEQTQEQAQAEEKVYENDGFKLTVSAEMADKVTVNVPEQSEDGVLFDVYETASVEAAKAMGEDYVGAGWLFAICKRDEASVHQIMCDSFGGEDILAVDGDGTYYVYYHPTDVRYQRETTEQMKADQEAWSAACEWADSVKESFIAENSGLTAIHFGGSEVENWLARTAYSEDLKYEISISEADAMEPKDVDPEPFVKRLIDNVTYEYVDAEAPDGEYISLNFPDSDTRLDFFKTEGNEEYVREVWGNGENVQIFKVTFADGTTKASDIMQEWYNALSEAK